nr:MAG: hypothetical protein DIU80_05370 [Chloroflexota bacterium]
MMLRIVSVISPLIVALCGKHSPVCRWPRSCPGLPSSPTFPGVVTHQFCASMKISPGLQPCGCSAPRRWFMCELSWAASASSAGWCALESWRRSAVLMSVSRVSARRRAEALL